MPFQTENVCVGKCHPHHLLEVGKDFTSSSVNGANTYARFWSKSILSRVKEYTLKSKNTHFQNNSSGNWHASMPLSCLKWISNVKVDYLSSKIKYS